MSDGLADGPVHVADGRIVSVGGPPQPAGQVIDARGGTVLPGLIPGSETCPCFAHGCEVVDGVDPLRRAVRERFRRGAHAIKIMTSGGVMSLADPIAIPQYSAEEIRAVADEAARRGSYVVAHAYSPEAIRHSTDNGVRSIEHGNLLDAQTAAAMASAGAFLVPTLAAYDAIERRGDQIGMTAGLIWRGGLVKVDRGLSLTSGPACERAASRRPCGATNDLHRDCFRRLSCAGLPAPSDRRFPFAVLSGSR